MGIDPRLDLSGWIFLCQFGALRALCIAAIAARRPTTRPSCAWPWSSPWSRRCLSFSETSRAETWPFFIGKMEISIGTWGRAPTLFRQFLLCVFLPHEIIDDDRWVLIGPWWVLNAIQPSRSLFWWNDSPFSTFSNLRSGWD